MWPNSKNQVVREKEKKEEKNIDCNRTKKKYLWQNSKYQIMTTQKLNLWQNSRIQCVTNVKSGIVTKLIKSHFDKTNKLEFVTT